MAVELTHPTTPVRQPTTHTEDTPDKKVSNPLKDNLAAIFGIIVIVAYAGFIFYMLTLTNLPDASWNRAVYLFGGTEAIAFAAAGALFGNTVQRQQTKKAEDDAKQAKRDQARAEQEKNQLNDRVGALGRAFARAETITEEKKASEQTLQELQTRFVELFPELAK